MGFGGKFDMHKSHDFVNFRQFRQQNISRIHIKFSHGLIQGAG